MAFQPIVDLESSQIFAFEALVRGVHGEPAGTILSLADETNLYTLDQSCRIKAIELAGQLGLPATSASLSINFYPNAVYNPAACLRKTIEASERTGFPLDRLIFELTEGEQLRDHNHLRAITQEYQARGMRVAIDDFGAGYAGLSLLAEFQPDLIKIDRELIRDIDQRPAARKIVASTLTLCRSLDVEVVAEGIERLEEAQTLASLGIRYLQGYYFARPGFEQLPPVDGFRL